MAFYKDVISDVDDPVVVSSGASRNVGTPLHDYMQAGCRQRVIDSVTARDTNEAIHKAACMLSGVDRVTRRSYIGSLSEGARRRVLEEASRLRRVVDDSGVSYTPDVCWAIRRVLRWDDPEGYSVLSSRYGELPAEVQRFYNAFKRNRYSTEAQAAVERLGTFELVTDAATSVGAYLSRGVKQEGALDAVIDKGRQEASALSNEAQSFLSSVCEDVEALATDFVDGVSEVYAKGFNSLVESQVKGGAREGVAAVLSADADDVDADDADNADDADDVDNADEAGADDVEADDDVSDGELPEGSQDIEDVTVTDSAPKRRAALVHGQHYHVADRRGVSDSAVSCSDSSVLESMDLEHLSDILARVSMGEDFTSEDEAYALLYDDDGGVYVVITPAASYTFDTPDEVITFVGNGHIDVLDQLCMPEALAEDVVADDAGTSEGVTTMADVDGGVPGVLGELSDAAVEASDAAVEASELSDVEESLAGMVIGGEDAADVQAAITLWAADRSAGLAVDLTDAVRLEAVEALGRVLSGLDVRVDASNMMLLCRNKEFVRVDVLGVYIGSTLYAYQTEADAIAVFASQVGSAAVQLLRDLYEFVEDSKPRYVEKYDQNQDTDDEYLSWSLDKLMAYWDKVKSRKVKEEDYAPLGLPSDVVMDSALYDNLEARLAAARAALLDALAQLSWVDETPAEGAAPVEGAIQSDVEADVVLGDSALEGAVIVADDEGSILTEEAKDEVLASVEDEITKVLKEKGIAVEDSVEIDTGSLREGQPNTYDVPHTLSTYRKIRDTRKVMDSVLDIASSVAGVRITDSRYRSMLSGSGKRNKALVSIVQDSAIASDNLDLLCPELYRRKLGDTYWVCDSMQAVLSVFQPSAAADAAACPCRVSTTPIQGSFKDTMEVQVGSRTLYIAH